jgi:hypothetical protein
MSQFAEPTSDITCPDCGEQGFIGESSFNTFSIGRQPDPFSMSFTCKRCKKPILVPRDKVAVSPDPLFQILGVLGTTSGMIQPTDEDVLESVVLVDSNGNKTVIRSGTAKAQLGDPKSGKPGTEVTIQIGKEPSFFVSPGVYREYLLPEPVDKVLTIELLPLVAPELLDKVQLSATPVRGSDGRYSSIRIAVATSATGILPEGRVNAICHFYVVPSMSLYAPWLRQVFEAIGQTNEGNFETALLDYSRACEIFIGDFLRETLRRTENFGDKLIEQVVKRAQVSDRVNRLLPLLTIDAAAYSDAQEAWNNDVKDLRDKKVAHVPLSVTRDEVRKAHDSAYWFIRAIQSQCRFEEGRQWDFWATLCESDTNPSTE